ncbi:hypothetical protein [Tianweitania sediminis]|uniref:Uncharacterized protein n=1 Tax=Tianweitania sediminis TaxID=1502156 RepID=A0A8J7R2W7_9HYPH|nr:hypothetical protein [Tianweitania sediminis]MBP0440642.1 hypothetical protein [Tianweitania sediminis]
MVERLNRSAIEKLTPSEVEALAIFAARMIRECWEGCEGGEFIQEQAEELGLTERTVFDPSKHKDPMGYADAGDVWFVFTPWLARALAKPQEAGRG